MQGENEMCVLQLALERYGVEDIELKRSRIEQYLMMMESRRDWAGLVSRSLAKDPEEAVVDSIGVLSVLSCTGGGTMVDIGSGSGLLGLVLAVTCSDWRVSLVESSGRKCAFLAEAVGALGLINVEVVRARVEEMVGAREFDVAVSRAAGKISQMAKVALGLLRSGGLYVALKGRDPGEEIERAQAVLGDLGGRLAGVTYPGSPPRWEAPGRTSLVVVEKM